MNTFRQRTLAGVLGLAALMTVMPLRADDTAYMTTQDQSFGTVDLQTGAFTLLGTTSTLLGGMAVLDGTLYATDFDGNLYRVDPTNGQLTQVGDPAQLSYFDFGADGTKLYTIDFDQANLYSIDPATNVPDLKGPTGFSSQDFADWSNLSSGSSTLYLGNGSSVYTVDTSDGTLNLLGDTGGPHIGGLVFQGGQLWGGVNPVTIECGDCDCGEQCGGNEIHTNTGPDGLNIVTIDTTTGVATIVAAVTGTSSPIFSLAVDVSTPEPATGFYMITALCLLGLLWRGRSRLSSSKIG